METSIKDVVQVWFISGTLLLPIAILTIRSYKATNSRLSLMLASLLTFSVLATYSWSIPLLFTQDERVIDKAILVGDIFFFTAMLVSAYMFWYLVLRKSIRSYWIMLPYYQIYLYLIFIEVTAERALENGLKVMIEGDSIVLVEYAPISALLYIPFFFNGVYFLLSAREKNLFYVRVRQIMLGLLFIGVSVLSAIGLLNGSEYDETNSTGVSVMILIIVFLAIFGIAGGLMKRFTRKN